MGGEVISAYSHAPHWDHYLCGRDRERDIQRQTARERVITVRHGATVSLDLWKWPLNVMYDVHTETQLVISILLSGRLEKG